MNNFQHTVCTVHCIRTQTHTLTHRNYQSVRIFRIVKFDIKPNFVLLKMKSNGLLNLLSLENSDRKFDFIIELVYDYTLLNESLTSI